MDLNSHLAEYHGQIKQTTFSKAEIKGIVSFIDLTSLDPRDTEENIINLCRKANSPLGQVAAVCVYPNFIPIASEQLKGTSIKIASVANFPSGNKELRSVITDIEHAISLGANEIDIVFPYVNYLRGEQEAALDYLRECRKTCYQSLLKVILEVSEFPNLEELYSLSLRIISTGVDFIKTSTGKSKHGATLEAASVMLLALKSLNEKETGFKVSGGIKTIEQAFSYINLAKKIMGEQWVKPAHFRIGTSSLIEYFLETELFTSTLVGEVDALKRGG